MSLEQEHGVRLTGVLRERIAYHHRNQPYGYEKGRYMLYSLPEQRNPETICAESIEAQAQRCDQERKIAVLPHAERHEWVFED
jgi:hypothetical protein